MYLNRSIIRGSMERVDSASGDTSDLCLGCASQLPAMRQVFFYGVLKMQGSIVD
jgi:hypothetical protein